LAGARRELEILAPKSLILFESLVRPPGFDFVVDPRTPPLITSDSLGRTPSPSASPVPANSDDADRLAPLFLAPQAPLLSPPVPSLPVRPVNRNKTLADVSIACTVGFSLRCASTLIMAKRKLTPVDKLAEAFV
jgi:hypothetical protein